MPKANGKASHQDIEQSMLRNDHEFSRTLEAAADYHDAEHKHWNRAFTFGDALIEECGDPGPRGVRTGSNAKLVKAQKFLEQKGFTYSIAHLRDLRKVAAAIPHKDRSESVSVTVYQVAGSAEAVEAVRKFARREELAQVTVADVKKYQKDQKDQREREDRQQQKKANAGKGPRPDPARVSATYKSLDNIAQARALIIDAEKLLKPYPQLILEEVDAFEGMIEDCTRILQTHQRHDDLPAVKDARSPAPQEDTEPEQGLHWTGDEDDGSLGCGLGDGGEMAFTVMPVRFKGCEHFEAKVLSGSDVDLTLPVSELATRYGTSLTNGRKGRRRTLDPYPTSEEARKQCELAYAGELA